jgi:hypothetical protein
MGKDFAMNEVLDIAWKRFPKLTEQDDWELGWYITASDMRNDKESATTAKSERSRRKVGNVQVRSESQGLLPMMAA